MREWNYSVHFMILFLLMMKLLIFPWLFCRLFLILTNSLKIMKTVMLTTTATSTHHNCIVIFRQ
ncbi:unnamed protein product [Trichobilharzia regenti]|nr:unnamed protein product [Trichobilharzia regenti]